MGGRFFILGLLALLGVLNAGCRTTSYYAQAIRGQYQIVTRQETIQKVLGSADTPEPLKDRLRYVLDLRQFAEDHLQLPANRQYLKYADLGRRFAVWNIYAAPEFSLTPKSWWYPIVGSLDYRGFFSEDKARKEAALLAKQGYDVFVGGVVAYSTLGWFRDPVLNTFVYEDDLELAELIFHELAHQRLFVPGDTDFNEAFATAVAEEGMRRWLTRRQQSSQLQQYEAQTRRAEDFGNLLAQARQRLEAIYGLPDKAPGQSPRAGLDQDRLRADKQAVFQELRAQYAALKESWGGAKDYDGWFQRPLNNARLNAVKTYHQHVPAFRNLLRQADGDLSRFYELAAALGELNEEERLAKLQELKGAPQTAHSGQ